MTRRHLAPIITGLSAIALVTALPAAAQNQEPSTLIEDNIPGAPVNYELEVLAEGLQSAWSIAFLPDDETYGGDMLVADKSGEIRVIRDDALLDAPVEGMPAVHYQSQAGLFDLVPHPDFAENGLLYMTYAHGTDSENGLRVSRATYVPTETGGRLEDLEVLFTADPLKRGSNHYGGRLVFMPDGTMIFTNGEGYSYKDKAPQLDTHFGKTLRLNADGSVPDDNPFVNEDGAQPEIWTYGHRNPQGLFYDAEREILWEHEHGPRGGDEVNIIEEGVNYGWPVITYGIDYSGAIISPLKEMDGMAQPLIHFIPSIAPSGLTIYSGDKFPDWQGDMFIGALAFQHVRHVEVDADGNLGDQQQLFTELDARIRDVRTGPDGYLYVLTDGDDAKVYRVLPQ